MSVTGKLLVGTPQRNSVTFSESNIVTFLLRFSCNIFKGLGFESQRGQTEKNFKKFYFTPSQQPPGTLIFPFLLISNAVPTEIRTCGPPT